MGINIKNSPLFYLSFPCIIFFICMIWGLGPLMAEQVIPIGVVLDFNSSTGSMLETCMSISLVNFYKQHAHYKTRVSLQKRDSKNDIITSASAAFDLIKKEKVHAIIGPQRSGQAKFVIELGRKTHVPIISFSATSPSLSPTRNPYFIRTALDDSSQVNAIAAIVETYGWREIILIYEDTEYGNGLIPYLNDAFVKIDTRVPYRSVIDPNSEEPEISKELNKLKSMNKKIFLVHMTAEHGSKLFAAANKASMTREGYAWIVTEGLSVVLAPLKPKMIDSMQGVLGVRPMVPKTEELEDFIRKWEASGKANSKLTLFGLWAYDTVKALAMAVENAGIADSSIGKQNVTFLNTILATKFQGLSGNFTLVKGQLEPSEFEVFNVVGQTERIIGHWSSQRGLFRDGQNSIGTEKLKQPIWPGDTLEQPTKLKIGVPARIAFNQFLKVEKQSPNGTWKFSGFVIDLFLEVRKVLPFPLPYEFVPVNSQTYDELLQQINLGKLDAVVGDVTIVSNRANYVDFTLPYSESGVSMVVKMKHDERQNMWIFLKPLSLGLWLTTGAAFVLTGFIIWFLEHRSNREFRGTPDQQLGTIFWFSFSTLVFAQKEKVVNNWSRFVLIIWVFVVLILTQSYTASLASMLTVERLQPAFIGVKEIKKHNYFVGYQNESFVKGLLAGQLGLNESMLKPYNNPEEYHKALSLGSNNGGVAAIFDEIPYIKLFLGIYGSKYAMVGPTYKTDGLGFAFPLKSPLVSYFSRAILNVTEDEDKFEGIKNKYFSGGPIFEDQSASITSDSPSLTVDSFAGLFIITLVASILSLLFYVFNFLYSQWPTLRTIHSEQRSFWSVVTQTAKHFDRKDSSLHPPNRSASRVHPAPAATPANDEASHAADDTDTETAHNEEADIIVTSNEDNQTLPPDHIDTHHRQGYSCN